MAPIRVGLIGLSAEPSGLSHGKWGVTAHLASYLPSPHYELVAVCNSSVESARRSIEFHKLPASVKAYGNAEGAALHTGMDPRTLRMRVEAEGGEAQVIDWEEDEPEHVKEVASPGTNTARVFEAYAQNRDRFADFEAALKLHKLLDRIAQDAGFL